MGMQNHWFFHAREKEFVLNDDKDISHGVKLIKAN